MSEVQSQLGPHTDASEPFANCAAVVTDVLVGITLTAVI